MITFPKRSGQFVHRALHSMTTVQLPCRCWRRCCSLLAFECFHAVPVSYPFNLPLSFSVAYFLCYLSSIWPFSYSFQSYYYFSSDEVYGIPSVDLIAMHQSLTRWSFTTLMVNLQSLRHFLKHQVILHRKSLLPSQYRNVKSTLLHYKFGYQDQLCAVTCYVIPQVEIL